LVVFWFRYWSYFGPKVTTLLEIIGISDTMLTSSIMV
jgi:hypothetical protein